MGTQPATSIWNLILLAFTVLFYAEIYIIANSDGISKLSEAEPLGLIAELGLLAVAWFFAVKPAVDKIFGKPAAYDAKDWKMHAINLLVLEAAAYLSLSRVMAESKDVTLEEGNFFMLTVLIMLVIPYALTEYLVNAIVNGTDAGTKMRAERK